MKRILTLTAVLVLLTSLSFAQHRVPKEVMKKIYQEVKTPYKYGLVMVPENNGKRNDCPTIFRKNGKWYMSYFEFDGRGYQTHLAESDDLLHWKKLGQIFPFGPKGAWDENQRGGYVSLVDIKWGGGYKVNKFNNKYWMSYIGGDTPGYEQGDLGIGIATTDDVTALKEWTPLPNNPIFTPNDKNVSWWDNMVQYKNLVIEDKKKVSGYRFLMYYNARGDSMKTKEKRGAERIGLAVSNDMTHWQRYGKEPLLNHHTGITGDAQIAQIGNVYVMFYFGAFWKPAAFERFACSHDLIHWTDWEGENLISPSEDFDMQFAHKPYVIKWKGIVYHFYNSVDKNDRRGIAVATSKDLGKSTMRYPEK
jgi:Predicted glycosylase